MEQTPDAVPAAHDAAKLKRFALDHRAPPHVRFAMLLAAHGLTDEAAAGMLQVSRPVVARTRQATRPPSFETAARIEALLGIPAAHWQDVPAILHQHARALNAAANDRAKAAKPRARKAA